MASIFVLIFVAELPDKTALATVLMATREKPFAVFIGAALAFVVQTGVAVFLGRFIGLLPERYIHIGSAALFFFFAFLAWRRHSEEKSGENGPSEKPFFKTVASAFLVIFVAEWGDLTQLATATLVAKYGEPLIIFVVAVLALWAATAVAVFAGRVAKSYFSEKVLNRAAAILFAAIGVYFALT